MSTADGPGTPVTRTSMPTAALTRRYPGSETDGIPASVTTSTRAPSRSRSTSSGVRSASLCSWNETHPAGGVDVEVLAEPAQPAGVLGGDDVGEAQLVGEARGGIPGVADRGRCQHQHAAAHACDPRTRVDRARAHEPPT